MKNLTWNSTATKAGTATGSSSSASASSRLTKDGTNVDEYLEAYKAKRAQKETVSENSRLTKDGTNVDEYFEEYKVRRGAKDTEAILSEYESLAKKYNDSIAGAQAYTSGGWKDASSGESILKTYEELKSAVDSLNRRTAGSEGVKNTLGHGRYYELLREVESMGASVDSALGAVKSASENYGRYDSADAYNRAMKLQGMSRETLQSEVDRLSGEMEALLSNPDYKIKSFVSAGPRSGQPLPSGVQSSRNGVAQLTLDGMQKYKELEDQRVEYQTVLNEREYADKAEKYNADPRSLGYSDLMKLLKTAEQEKESDPGRYEFVKSYYDGLSESELYDLQGLDKITRLSKAERAKLDKIYELAFALESAGMATGSRFSAEYHMKKKLVENGMNEEEAESLANHYIRYQNALKRQASQQEYAESVQSSTGDAFRLNLLTFPANLIGGISSVLGNVSQYISNEISGKDIPLDPNAGYNKYTNFTTDVRSATQSEIEKAADFEIAGVNVAGTLYNTVMSGIDSGLAILAGGAIGGAMGVLSGAGASATAGASSAVVKRAASATSGLIMGSNAAGQEIIQSLEKGDSDIKALARGIAVGTVENITEKFSVDALFDIAHGKGSVIKKALQSFVSEGTEEVISNWGTSLVDYLSGEGFRFESLIKQYTDQGYSRETAVQKAGADIVTEDAVTFIAGGLTGAVMSAGFAIYNQARAKQYTNYLENDVNGAGYAAFMQGINERMGAVSEISDEAEQAKAKEAVENSIRLRQAVIESAANNVRNTEVLKEYLGEEGFKAEIDHITEQKRTLDGILSEIEAGTYNVEERAAEAKELVNRYAQETAEGKVKKKAASYAENLLRQLGLKNADKTLQHNIGLLETDVKNGVKGAAETLKFTREALASVKSYTDKDIANMLGGTVQGGDKVKVDAAVGVKLDHAMPQNVYAKYDVKTGDISINPYAVATAEAQMRQSSEYSESNMAKVKVVHEAGHAAAQADSSFVSQMYEVYSRLKAEGIVASYEVNEGSILDTYKKAGVIDSYLNTSSAKAQVQKLVQDGASTEDATNAVIDAYMQEEYVMNFLEYVEKSGGKLYESLASEKRNVFVRAVQKIAEIFRGIAAKIRGTNVSSAQKMEDMAVRLTEAVQRFAATSLQDANTATDGVDSSVVSNNTTEGENVETGNGTAAQNEDARWSLSEIHETVEEAILNRGQIDEKYNQKKISRVPERLAEMVLEASGGEINISDKYIALSGSEIYHEYKRHSDSAIESSRDQIAMTQNEITEAIAAIFDPDIVEGMFTTKDNPTQRQSFAYAKKALGYYVVAEAVGGNRNPNIVPVMIIQVTEAKWNRYMESGKTIGEMLNENDVEMLNALDVEKNKNNRVIAAQFVSQETIANTPHSPRSDNSIAQNGADVNSENEDVRYSLVGETNDGIEIYETSEEVRALPFSERKKLFTEIMREQYAGRTAKFTRNGHVYYARFDESDISKNVYGDKRSSFRGYRAKINVGADGNIFELVENATYNGSRAEVGKDSAAHKNVQYWDYFVKTVRIDGRYYDITANVRKTDAEEFVYSIQLNESKIKRASPPIGFHEKSVRSGEQRSTNSIAQNAENVNSENADVRYSLVEYTEHQKQNWKNSKRIVVFDNAEQLEQFIRDSVYDKTMDKKMYFGAIPPDLTQRIKEATGVNVENYNLSLGSYEIRKILKDHGDTSTEAFRGQRAVTPDDFSHIVDVVLNPIDIKLSPNTYNGKPAIIFTGNYNGRMNVVAVVSDKRLDLFVQTIYANAKKENLPTPTGEQAPINTPKANSGMVSFDKSIAQGEETVNTSDEDSRLSLSSAAEDRIARMDDASRLTYETLGSKSDIKLTKMTVPDYYGNSDRPARGYVVGAAMNSAHGKKNPKNTAETAFVRNLDTGNDIIVTGATVQHWLQNQNKYNLSAVAAANIGDLVENAVHTNKLTIASNGVDGDIYFSAGVFEKDLYLCRMLVNASGYVEDLEVKRALDAKKELDADSTISIEDFLQIAKRYFSDVLPGDVLQKTDQVRPKTNAPESTKRSPDSNSDEKRIARLKEDNTFLRAQMKAGRKTALSPAVLDNLLRDMRSEWGVSVEDNQAMKDMFRIVDNVSNSGKGMSDAVMERLRGMAEKLLSDVYVTDDQNMRENEAFIKHIKSMTLSVPADNESDLSGGYGAYRRQNMKYVKLARNGTPVDTVYDELCNVFPGLLDRSVANPADQIDEIVAVMKSLQPVEVPAYSGMLSDASISFVNDIMAKYERGARETYSAMRDKKQQKAVDRASTAYEARIRQIEYRAAKDAEEYEAIIDRYQQKEWDGKMAQSRRDYSKSVLTNARAIRAAAVSPNQKKFIPEAYRESAKNIAQWLSDVSLFNGSITMDIANRVTADFARLSELYGEDFGSISTMLLDEVNSFANSQSEDHALKATYVMRAAAKLSHLLRRSIVNHNRIVLDGKKKSAADTGDALVRDLNTRKFAEKEFNTMEASGALERAAGNVRRGLKAISLNTMDGYSFLHRMGKVGDMLYDTLRAAQSKQVLYVKEYVDLLNDQLVYNKKTNADGVDLSVYTGNKPKMVEVTMANGAKMRMTAVQAMNIVSAYERAAGKEHIENGGVRLWDGEKKAYSRAFSLTATDVAALRSALDTDDLRVMDVMNRFIREDCTKWGNEATLERYGFHRFTTKDYFPLKVDRNAIPADMVKGYSVPYNVSNVGFAKATTEGASAPLLIDSFIDVVNRHVEGMATYAAYLSAEDTVNRIMSAPGVRDAMQRSLGSGSVKYMEDLMTALKGGGQSSSFTDSITDWWTKQAGHYKSAAVSYNASTAAKQPLSYIRALAVIDQKYLLKGLHGDGKSAHEQMMQYSGIGVKKDMGYSEVGVAKSIGNQIGYEKKGLGKVIRDFNEFGMKGASFMDKVTWDALWIACREEVLEMNPGISTDHTVWMEKTAKRFSEVVARTQVVDSPLDSAFKISRSNNPLVRNLFAFTNEPMKGFNLIMNSVNDLINTEKGSAAQKRARGALGKVLGVSVASWAMEALVSSIFRAVRDDDDDPGVVLEEFWPNMKSNMFGAIPYVAQLTDIISDAYNGYDFTDIGISNLVDIVESAKSLSSTLDNPESKQEKVFKQVRDLIEAVGTFAGIPIRNIDRTLVNATKAYFHLTDNYVGEYNLQKMLYNPNSNTAREKHEFNSLLADAYLSGDREAYEAIANDMRAHGVSTQAIIAGIAKDSFADDLANSDSSSLVKFKVGSEPWYIGMKAIFGRELGAPDGTEKEITRVYTLTGDTNILPKFKDGTYSVNKEERQIDGAAYDAYLTEYGSTMYEVVNAMRNMEAYRRASSAEQAWWITKAENYAAAVSIYHRDKEYNLTSRGKWIGEYAESRAVDVARYIVENLSR